MTAPRSPGVSPGDLRRTHDDALQPPSLPKRKFLRSIRRAMPGQHTIKHRRDIDRGLPSEAYTATEALSRSWQGLWSTLNLNMLHLNLCQSGFWPARVTYTK